MPGLLQCKVNKYTIVVENDGQVRVERGDDPNWMVNPEGSKMLIAVANEINRLRENTAAPGQEPKFRFFCPNQITDESDEKREPMCVDLDCSWPSKPCAGGYKPDA